jgi:hypothetical protein
MKKYKILYTPASIEQIKYISKWYSGINKKLGNRFKENLKTAIEPLKTNPFTNSFRYDEVRFAVTYKFPYAAHYTVDKENFFITIHAVFAFKENPEKWLKDL